MIIHTLILDILQLHPPAYLIDVFSKQPRDECTHHVDEGDAATALLVEVLEQGDRDELQGLVALAGFYVVYIIMLKIELITINSDVTFLLIVNLVKILFN